MDNLMFRCDESDLRTTAENLALREEIMSFYVEDEVRFRGGVHDRVRQSVGAMRLISPVRKSIVWELS